MLTTMQELFMLSPPVDSFEVMQDKPMVHGSTSPLSPVHSILVLVFILFIKSCFLMVYVLKYGCFNLVC